MRNAKFGALALGLGLAVSVALPVAAQEEEVSAVEQFGTDFLAAAGEVGIGEATEEVFENVGTQEEEFVVTVIATTPFNPIVGDVVEVEDDVTFGSEE